MTLVARPVSTAAQEARRVADQMELHAIYRTPAGCMVRFDGRRGVELAFSIVDPVGNTVATAETMRLAPAVALKCRLVWHLADWRKRVAQAGADEDASEVERERRRWRETLTLRRGAR